MPVLDELSKGVRSSLASKSISIGPYLDAIENVEHWLTLLADPAPWLTASDQQRNSALFLDISQAIYEVVYAMQAKASIVTPPDWLFPLVKYWHRMRSTVVTFNYDSLVELAYCDAVEPPSPSATMLASDLLGIPITPAAMRTTSIYGHNPNETFRLLKLHGSLDWWYSGPQADASDPIYGTVWIGDFNRGFIHTWSVGERTLIADKVPMLIPPAATKAPFYRNRLLAAQWAEAATALNEAEEIVFMGYSAPLTDLTVTTLIATQFKGDAIVPVNPDRSVLERANEIGSNSHRPKVVDRFICADAIAEWVRTFAL
jgi:hypothetical protein